MSLKEFGEMCRKAREERGWTHRDVADATGYFPQAINSVEIGSVHECFDACRLALADAFNLPLPDICLKRN